jgi:hypothetical protein
VEEVARVHGRSREIASDGFEKFVVPLPCDGMLRRARGFDRQGGRGIAISDRWIALGVEGLEEEGEREQDVPGPSRSTFDVDRSLGRPLRSVRGIRR